MKTPSVVQTALAYLCIHNVPQKYRVGKTFASAYGVVGVPGDVLVSASFKGCWENHRLKKGADKVIQKMEKVPYSSRLGGTLSCWPKEE